MNLKSNFIDYSPNDLLRFLDSPFSSWMDRASLINEAYLSKKDNEMENITKQILFQEGLLVEKDIISEIKRGVVNFIELKFSPEKIEDNIKKTIDAMKNGVKYIFQAHLKDGHFYGIADVLEKREGKSSLGNYHYIVKDIKRSPVPKSKFIIQICSYCDMLEKIQGVRPLEASILLGNKDEEFFNVDDYFSFYLNLKNNFLNYHSQFDINNMPIPDEIENNWYWSNLARDKMIENESLNLLGNVDKEEIKELSEYGITKISDITDLSNIDLSNRVKDRIIKQKKAYLEKSIILLENDKSDPKGLFNLPPLNEEDIFLDVVFSENLSKDGFVFLYNIYFFDQENSYYKNKIFESYNKTFEEKTYKRAILFIRDTIKEKGKIYIYSKKTYENLIKVASEYDTFVPFVEGLYFKHKFIDIESILKQSFVFGIENYTIEKICENIGYDYKELESETSLFSVKTFGKNPSNKERANEFFYGVVGNKIKAVKYIYDWLNIQQKESGLNYIPFNEREEYAFYEEKQNAKDDDNKNEDKLFLENSFTFDLEKYKTADKKNKVIMLLKQLSKFHSHESKPNIMEKQELYLLSENKWKTNPRCLAFLKLVNIEENIITYSFEKNQETKIKEGDVVSLYQNKYLSAKVVEFDIEKNKIALNFSKNKIKYAIKYKNISIMETNHIPSDNIEKNINRYLERMDDNHENLNISKAIFDFFIKAYPTISGKFKGYKLYDESKELLPQAIDVISKMDNTCLSIQGPPGAGKTYISSNVIAHLVKNGKKVAISSNSHKAINNLLIKTKELVNTQVVKINKKEDDLEELGILCLDDKKYLKEMEKYSVVGGTVFKLSKADLNDHFDYLFIDEAGQVCLANLLAMGVCAKNIVLIGDQMQLEQPIQALHPGDSGKSALEYLLEGYKTIPSNYGFFLAETRRMNKELCHVVSKYFYEGKLYSHESANKRRLIISNSNVYKEKGFQFIDIYHKNNSQYSKEEVKKIKEIVDDLLLEKLEIDGIEREITLEDIIIVSPYNMQVSKIKKVLPEAKVGSVDLFQGQEAPIVIFSLAASSSGSRGIEFLLNENRINVALSRGKCLAIMVGSPEIVNSKADNINELRLLNLFCELRKFK